VGFAGIGVDGEGVPTDSDPGKKGVDVPNGKNGVAGVEAQAWDAIRRTAVIVPFIKCREKTFISILQYRSSNSVIIYRLAGKSRTSKIRYFLYKK
jgi:hypothetical protein